ncbi:hypothetical protein KO516_15930 [Citreicella sp. C3M06]|uniref:hypothetical protein n=1 Tax=Citreicella sp. C3M06 TaxID=2841564 RepID=UPI001C08CB39|nr:hypothetical protein [Citreicella sp. C3M06]MBU2962278.1 hypothetical protein [Citreicella sp. C3M06]
MIKQSATKAGLLALALATLSPQLASAQSLNTREWTFVIGRSVPLTRGERSSIRYLIPGVDMSRVSATNSGKLRGVLHSDRSDSYKRNQIKWLLKR